MKQYIIKAYNPACEAVEVAVYMLDNGKKSIKVFDDRKAAAEFTAELEADGFMRVRRFQYGPNPCTKVQMI